MATRRDVDLVALRAAYETGGKALRAIAKDFKIGAPRLNDYAEAGGWVRQAVMPKCPKRAGLDLVSLRRDYENSIEPVRQTAQRFGISLAMLYDIAIEERWARSRRAYREDALTRPKQPPGALPRQEDQKTLIARLYGVLGLEIDALCAREDADPASGTARQLEQLVKCFKTINDLQAALGAPGAENDGQSDKRSAEEIRAALLGRLAPRLAAQRAGGSAREPD